VNNYFWGQWYSQETENPQEKEFGATSLALVVLEAVAPTLRALLMVHQKAAEKVLQMVTATVSSSGHY
jgi:hypothetical protein